MIKKEQFTAAQAAQIKYGFNNGLTNDQIALYADPKYSWRQMCEIRLGLEHGLTQKQIAVYADPRFNSGQMREIHWGLENGLSKEQVALYADPQFNTDQMDEIRWGLEDGLTQEQIALYANPQYTWEQMDEIRQGLEDGLTQEKVAQYADPKFLWRQMNEIRTRLDKQKLSQCMPTMGENPVFEYQGYHFVAVGQFPNESWNDHVQHTISDVFPHLTKQGVYGLPYSHKEFYKAYYKVCKKGAADIFQCVETGALYVPGENELFGYKGNYRPLPPQKKKNRDMER